MEEIKENLKKAAQAQTITAEDAIKISEMWLDLEEKRLDTALDEKRAKADTAKTEIDLAEAAGESWDNRIKKINLAIVALKTYEAELKKQAKTEEAKGAALEQAQLKQAIVAKDKEDEERAPLWSSPLSLAAA